MNLLCVFFYSLLSFYVDTHTLTYTHTLRLTDTQTHTHTHTQTERELSVHFFTAYSITVSHLHFYEDTDDLMSRMSPVQREMY